MSTCAKSSTKLMATASDDFREELKALHDRGVTEEKERQFGRAAETFRKTVELSRHEVNPLVRLHCQWHHAMLLIELGRYRQGLHALGPLLTDDLQVTSEQNDYLCDGMELKDLRIAACIVFVTAGLAASLPRKTIVTYLERFRQESALIPGKEGATAQAVYQLCNIEYFLHYHKYQAAMQAAELTLARLPAHVGLGKFLCRAAEACLGLGDIDAARSYLERSADERGDNWSFSSARVRVALELRQQNLHAARLWAEQALIRSRGEGRRTEKRQAARQFVEVALASGDLEAGRQGLTELLRYRHGESQLERLELRLCLAGWRQARAARDGVKGQIPFFERAKELAASIDSVAGTRFKDVVEQWKL